MTKKRLKPQPVSSESDGDESMETTNTNNTPSAEAPSTTNGDPLKENQSETPSNIGLSRLFAPYRSLGIVSSGPFHLLPNQDSANAMACVAIGERFHILQCDRLHPVLVSKAVPGKEGSPQQMSHLVSDGSLSVSVVAHGPVSMPRHVTLFQRTRPVASIRVAPNKDFTIVEVTHLGRTKIQMDGEKKGRTENAALCAVVLSKGRPNHDAVPVVGDDGDDSDSDSGSSSDDSSDSESVEDCRGQVVLLVATRTSLHIHKRIRLVQVPSFVPCKALHPSTYVNKILLAGYVANKKQKSSLNSSTKQHAMILLNVKTTKIIHVFSCLPSTNGPSEITALEQSPVLDTIAVGNSQGIVHLVNVRHDKLLFSLRHKPRRGRNNETIRITSIAFRTDGSALQYGIAPMAVGRSDGNITIWDLTPEDDGDDSDGSERMMGRTLLCEMEQVHYPGGVCQLQYLPQEPLLLSTGTKSNSIQMHIFDNPDHSGRLLRQRNGHTSPPQHIRYLNGAQAGRGVLVNAADGTDASSCQILSSGGSDRTLRLFSTVRTVLDKEYSQGRGLDKRAKELGMTSKAELLLPPLIAMATAEARSRDWGDLVTIHRNHAFAYVWSSKRGAQSGPVLRQDHWNVSAMKKPPPTEAHATSIAMSSCGNYALVGTRGGVIYKYNVQSGNTRGSYPVAENMNNDGVRKRRMAGNVHRTAKVLEKSLKVGNRASNVDKNEKDVVEQAKIEKQRNVKLKSASHAGSAVVGIAVDSLNKTVISVGSDAKLILWNFVTHAPHKKSPCLLPAKATKLCHVRDSDLAAIALDDFTTILFDCSSLRIVRRFGVANPSACHTGPISDLGFSPDGRTLFTSSWDGTVRVWDVPTNSCIDWLGFSSPPTSLTVSPTGEYLATTHRGKLGISLWSDRSYYQTVHIDSAQQLSTPARMDDPMPIADVESGDKETIQPTALNQPNSSQETKAEQDEESTGEITVAKEKGLITMSGLPPAHWKNLFHLELVKQRNKPEEAPKKPPSAPFFLQWRPSENPEGDLSKNVDTVEEEKDDEEWNAAWSDDDVNDEADVQIDESDDVKRERPGDDDVFNTEAKKKKPKISHYRSHLAALLEECSKKTRHSEQSRFKAVTDHFATLGPSAIDLSLSTLCNGMHDLEEGLPLLHLAASWLLEACESRERYEAVNAYLHRFLYLHANTIAGINTSTKVEDGTSEEMEQGNDNLPDAQHRLREELIKSVASLRNAQRKSSVALNDKMQNALCLLRHFSRMV